MDAGNDPYKRLLESDLAVQRVLCRGQWIAATAEPGLP
jgi:hypothetical protein